MGHHTKGGKENFIIKFNQKASHQKASNEGGRHTPKNRRERENEAKRKKL